jgi:hypothetical protein
MLFSWALDVNFLNILGHVFNSFVDNMPVVGLYRGFELKQRFFDADNILTRSLSEIREPLVRDMKKMKIESSTLGEKGSVERDYQITQNVYASLSLLGLMLWAAMRDDEEDDEERFFDITGADIGKTERDKYIRGKIRPRNSIIIRTPFGAIMLPEWINPSMGISAALVGNYLEMKKDFVRKADTYRPEIEFGDKMLFALKSTLQTGGDFIVNATPFKSWIQPVKEQQYLQEGEEGFGTIVKPALAVASRKLGMLIPNFEKQIGDMFGKQSAKPKDWQATAAMATGIYRFTPSNWYEVQKAYDIFGEPVQYMAGEQYMPTSHWRFVTNPTRENKLYKLVYDKLGLESTDLQPLKKNQLAMITLPDGSKRELPLGSDYKVHEKAIMKVGKRFRQDLGEFVGSGGLVGLPKDKAREKVKEIYKKSKEKVLRREL